MKKTMLTWDTLDRFEAEYSISNYTTDKLKTVEHYAYLANVNQHCYFHEYSDDVIYEYFLEILNRAKIALTPKAA